MKTIEITARTVDEAVKVAAERLGVPIESIKIDVLEESSKGFWGILGGKQARIKASIKEDGLKKAKEYIMNVTKKIGAEANVSIEEAEDYVKITLSGENMGVLIGRRGETLDALQYLVNLVANRRVSEKKRIILDAEGYRKRREATLEKLAHKLADRVRRTGQQVVLEPMNPQERRIIHTTLQNDRYVKTMSEGEEPYRKVIILPRR
ncbi:MAG: RNA-binding cell elongation regulator Jag/EloR [Peptococcaceae bacterium]|jgi:spoIIIJ-associated protein|nr:protein jag [Peptococcaceae bacterium]MDH7523821.1 RNA-binding cell elongation regulator Jag/EloR [Peptococcaceae bacterium]